MICNSVVILLSTLCKYYQYIKITIESYMPLRFCRYVDAVPIINSKICIYFQEMHINFLIRLKQ